MLDFLIFAAFVSLLVVPCVVAGRRRAAGDLDDEENRTVGLLDHAAFPSPKPQAPLSERRPRVAARHVDPQTARTGGTTIRARSQSR